MKSNVKSTLSGFFANEQLMLIFALIYLDQDLRVEILGINEEMYESAAKAKRWRAKIVKKIHPDYCPHPQASAATAKLNSIYEGMIRHAK